MKFIVSSEVLLKELQVIGGIINSSNTLPILDNFLFHLNSNQLVLTASDLDLIDLVLSEHVFSAGEEITR